MFLASQTRTLEKRRNEKIKFCAFFTCVLGVLNDSNLIYVLTCNGCDKYYIGQTGDTLRSRTRIHRQQINDTSTSFIFASKHIAECAVNLGIKFKIFPFYKMQSNSKADRIAKEEYFIKKMEAQLNASSPPS